MLLFRVLQGFWANCKAKQKMLTYKRLYERVYALHAETQARKRNGWLPVHGRKHDFF